MRRAILVRCGAGAVQMPVVDHDIAAARQPRVEVGERVVHPIKGVGVNPHERQLREARVACVIGAKHGREGLVEEASDEAHASSSKP